MKLLLACSILLLFSCSNPPQTSKDSPRSFKAFRLLDEKGAAGPGMDEKGTIVFEGKTLGTMTASGDIRSAQNALLASYKNDTLYAYGPSPAKIKIDDKGAIYEEGNVRFSWDKDGNLKKDNRAVGYKISPNDPAAYTHAAIVFLLYAMLAGE